MIITTLTVLAVLLAWKPGPRIRRATGSGVHLAEGDAHWVGLYLLVEDGERSRVVSVEAATHL